MAGKETQQPPANQPPANQPPANQPPANQPPANQPPPAADVAAQLAEFQKTVTDQFKSIGDQLANVGKPAPRDPLTEIDKINETVKDHAQWVAQQASRVPNWFERTFLGHQRPPAAQQPPPQQ